MARITAVVAGAGARLLDGRETLAPVRLAVLRVALAAARSGLTGRVGVLVVLAGGLGSLRGLGRILLLFAWMLFHAPSLTRLEQHDAAALA
jgi:hypothetical protein